MAHIHHHSVLPLHHQHHEHFRQHPHHEHSHHEHPHPDDDDHKEHEHEHHHEQSRRLSQPQRLSQSRRHSQPYNSSRSAAGVSDEDQINLAHFTSCSGILELVQLVLGAIVIFMILYNNLDAEQMLNPQSSYTLEDYQPILFALSMATAFFICTCCLLLTTLLSSSQIKPIYEFVYHLIGAFLLFGAAATLYIKMLDDKYKSFAAGGFQIAAGVCFLNSFVYLANAIKIPKKLSAVKVIVQQFCVCLLNFTEYLSTLLKLAQLSIGCVCAFLIITHYHPIGRSFVLPNLLFLLMVVTFLVGTLSLLIFLLFSSVKSDGEAEKVYELIYHSIGAIFLLISSVYMIVRMQDHRNHAIDEIYRVHMVAGALTILNALLYGGCAALAKFGSQKS